MSIIINNYNYERYVGTAIESALRQTHPNVEVIVVDDGSTDGSRAVIERYASKARVVCKPNGGQASALNVGFAASTGDIVMFLDADDTLEPNAAASVQQQFATHPHATRVMFRLALVDAEGRTIAPAFPDPRVRFGQGDQRGTLSRLGPLAYICPPTSGNAFRRSDLAHVMPIPEPARYRVSADAYLFIAAPFTGPAVATREVLGAYRLHGSNNYLGHATYDLGRFARELDVYDATRDDLRALFATHDSTREPDPGAWRHPGMTLKRVILRREAGRSARDLWWPAVTAAFRWPDPPVRKVIVALVVTAVTVLPRGAALRVARASFDSTVRDWNRPRFQRRQLTS